MLCSFYLSKFKWWLIHLLLKTITFLFEQLFLCMLHFHLFKWKKKPSTCRNCGLTCLQLSLEVYLFNIVTSSVSTQIFLWIKYRCHDDWSLRFCVGGEMTTLLFLNNSKPLFFLTRVKRNIKMKSLYTNSQQLSVWNINNINNSDNNNNNNIIWTQETK